MKKINVGLIGILILLAVYVIKIILNLNILPGKILLVSVVCLFLLLSVAGVFLFCKKKYLNIIGFIFSILLGGILVIGIYYGNHTEKFFATAFLNNKVEQVDYQILILRNSSIKKIEDLDGKTLGVLSSDKTKDAYIKKLNISPNILEYEDVYDIYLKLQEGKVEAMLLEDAFIAILEEENPSLYNNLRVLYSFSIEEKIPQETLTIKELKPFSIYISGSDSRSNVIYSKTRSDVNMLLTVNPDTKKVLITSVPRDYYVQIHNRPGLKDKLTHVGIYGIEASKDTMGDLFNIKVDYSIKVGMTSIVKLVDLVDGIEIESDREFKSYHIPGWIVKKGTNKMNGAEALAYARERYAYASGDRHRIQNQQQVLSAVLKKIMNDKNLLLKYEELLTTFSNLYRTDLPKDIVSLLVKQQLTDFSSWEIITQTVSGKDAREVTYSTPKTKLYVMVPFEHDVSNATKKINDLLTGN